MPPEIVTFGCRMNTFESELMRQHATVAGLSELTVIVNTCAVTGEAERQARQVIRRLKRERPKMQIIVTGCAVQLSPETFATMPEVDRVLGNTEKLRVESWTEENHDDSASLSVVHGLTAAHNALLPTKLTGFAKRMRAFLAVQQGCEHRCTFCIIPFVRGFSRSLPPAQVVTQARSLTAAGYRELVVTGVDVTSYGLDLPGDTPFGLGKLVARLLTEVPGLERLRLSSLDPVEIDEELLAVFGADRRFMPHIHLSVQAGDDLILKRMRRRHGRADVIRVTERLRALRPEVTFGADLIAGFPTESEAMFANTLRLVRECGLTHLHVFPFSARPGTPAARMPAVAGTAVRERAVRLRAAAAQALALLLVGRVGTVDKVLVEKSEFGYSEDYLPVRLSLPEAVPGNVVQVRLTTATATHLDGDILP